MAFFQCKYAFSNENMTFYINKRRRKTTRMAFSMPISLFRCLSEGSAGINIFTISNISEFALRGGGSSLIGNFSQISPFFLVTPPLSKSAQLKLRLRLSLANSEFDSNIAKLGIYRIYQKNSFHGYFYMKVLPCDNMTVI